MPRLIRPTTDLHDAFLAAHREWGDGLHEDGFGITPEDDIISPDGFAAWVERVDERPATSWWIVDDEPADLAGRAAKNGGGDDTIDTLSPDEDGDSATRILGAIALRPTEFSGDLVTGHVGYGVTPSARGRGIATWALRAALGEAAKLGLPTCVLVCLDDNVASIRTIERCGGCLESIIGDDDGVRRRIYRIDLAPSTTDDAQHSGERRRKSR